jgi:hypothetical protein
MPFCRACGTAHADADRFCGKCGTGVGTSMVAMPLQAAVYTQLVAPFAPSTPHAPAPPTPDSRPRVRGWLRFCCISLTIFTPLSCLFWAAVIADVSPAGCSAIFAYAVLSFGVGVMLWTRTPGAPTWVRWTLFGWPFVLLFVAKSLESVGTITSDEVFGQTVSGVCYSIPWVIYLTVSRRVKATFPEDFEGTPPVRSW